MNVPASARRIPACRTAELVVLLLLFGGATTGRAGPPPPAGPAEGGRLEAIVNGAPTTLPMLTSDMRARIQGDLATVHLSQTFENQQTAPMHARYVFPLPANAAVYAMRIVSGDRMIEAEIRRKPEARAVFEAAKQRGNQASLLTQHRPNVFTQEVANLLPGLPIRVELEYAHPVEKVAGDFEFRFPMLVGPRYLKSGDGEAVAGESQDPEPLEIATWSLPASSPVAPPSSVDRERVQIEIELEAGMPIAWLDSPTHPLDVRWLSEQVLGVGLADGPTLDDGDFVLRYALAQAEVAAGVTRSVEGGTGYLSLLIEPPKQAAAAQLTPREVVFVLDCSGSMSGTPLDASKRFMRTVLPQLREGDHFRIIRFSDAASEWTHRPMRATAQNVETALDHIGSLYGSGGTHMTSGIRAALAPPIPPGALRLVVFLTDGYIGDDAGIVRLIQQMRGEARLFSFGIGSSVNRYLLKEIARVGRGAARIVLPEEDAADAADELAERLARPVLTDVWIDWGDAAVHDVLPAEIPDLFLGQSVRVMAKVSGKWPESAALHGRIAGRPTTLPLEIESSELPGDSLPSALPIVWARQAIEDRMISYLDPTRGRAEQDALEEEVTRLGLDHSLVTQWTSFVAVARPIVNPGGAAATAEVAVPKARALADAAYPASALPPGQATPANLQAAGGLMAGGGFAGSAAPEPGTWIALAALSVMTALISTRHRRGDSAARR